MSKASLLAATIFLALGTSANASSLSNSALLPFTMKYEPCAHSGTETAQEAIRARCAAERQGILRDAEKAISAFHPADVVDARNALISGMNARDRYAAKLSANGQQYPLAAVRYIECLSRSALADPQFLAGKSLRGKPLARLCRPTYEDARNSIPRGAAGRIALSRIGILKAAFETLYVMPNSASDGEVFIPIQ